jgi:hypothetical protein
VNVTSRSHQGLTAERELGKAAILKFAQSTILLNKDLPSSELLPDFN